ncbi:MAG: hypothetical protein Q8K43_13145 [Sulfurimicrobium sp.]|jgi:hypothetical protein|nr:hypothetical protein [Sulfurimicrobium sp.]MDO9191010.1 hypothetical protein [Sulfurimicrobium sp.]MDP1704546.1 hypothetical protein [Sulfurimicrobium sp.]MDP1898820.1 hypothetical protein [Sulfurimicrobium sp.]MDP2197771.1 hypothetical protein [Sulfurimicrobium sp.]
MWKKIGSALLLGALLLALPVSAFAARGYEGYNDVLDVEPWFDGVRSTIDYQVTTVDSESVVAWCGIDNNGVGGWKWIQGGWDVWKNGSPRIYWEYIDKDGNYNRGWDAAPGATEIYESSRNGANVEWKHGDIVYKTEAWSKFEGIAFRKVYYGAEMHDSPGDHTPGKVESKNNFASSMARRAGGDFAVTGLSSQAQPTAQQGNVEKYGDEASGNFRTWDSRND